MTRKTRIKILFQSTPSAWRVTADVILDAAEQAISIHTLRMEGDVHFVKEKQSAFRISIHTLRMEGDIVFRDRFRLRQYFKPHPPHGG